MHLKNITCEYDEGTSAFSTPQHILHLVVAAICKTICPTPDPRSINISSSVILIRSIIWQIRSNDVSPYT